MRPQTILIKLDGALLGQQGGWGVVIAARAQEWISFGACLEQSTEWISFGACLAQSTDEVEFRAVLQGLQLAVQLELLQIRTSLRIVNDSKRLIQAW